MSKELTTRRIPIPEKMMVVGGNTWILMSGHRQVTKVVAVAHHTHARAKGGGESVEDIHSWIEPFCESFIAALRLVQFSGFRFKYGEDGFGGNAAVYFSSEGVGSQLFPSLLLILL
jgi:hypothetical protein